VLVAVAVALVVVVVMDSITTLPYPLEAKAAREVAAQYVLYGAMQVRVAHSLVLT
jgi:hypothetical protein